MNPVIEESWRRMEEARLIISRATTPRGGLPDAWCKALMHLRREVHIPANARADWAWLTNEMGRSIESRRDNCGMQFLEGISKTEIRDMYYAFDRIYWRIANLAAGIEVTAAPEMEATQQMWELCPVSYDFSFRVH